MNARAVFLILVALALLSVGVIVTLRDGVRGAYTFLIFVALMALFVIPAIAIKMKFGKRGKGLSDN